MGGVNSTPSQNGQQAQASSPPVIIPQPVVEKFEGISKILEEFGTNDPNFISKYINDYNNSLPAGKENLRVPIEDGKLLKKLDDFHKNVVKYIGFQKRPDGSLDIKSNQIYEPDFEKGFVKNQAAADDFVSKMKTPSGIVGSQLTAAVLDDPAVDKPTKELYARVTELFNKDPNVKQTAENIVGSIVNLKSRYTFFEYKYVQLNIFVLVMIRNMYSIMQGVLENIIKLVVDRDNKRNQQMNDILKMVEVLLKLSSKITFPPIFLRASWMFLRIFNSPGSAAPLFRRYSM